MNAIIVAAGFGSRLRPLTYSTPKPLIEVFNQPIIEKNIEFLLEKGIDDINVIVGYAKERFEYLREKYQGVKLVYNEKYNEYNNIYSLYLVKDYLEDSYIIEGDIFLNKNIFDSNIKNSCYFSKKVERENEEWQLILENNKVKRVEIGGKGNHIMSGISFWKKEDSLKIKELLEEYVQDEEKKKKYYWDHIIKENIEKFDNIGIVPLEENDIYEIDTLDELKELDKSYINILENKVKTAVILAAGESHGFKYPNGLVKVNDFILLERNIELLLKNEIEKVYIVIGYCKEQFNYLVEKYRNKIILIENQEYREKGSYYSLLKLKGIIKENILLLDSDILYEERALKNVLENKNSNVILVSEEKGQKNETYVEEIDEYLYKISKDRRELKNIQGEMLGVSKISYFLLNYLFNLNVENKDFAYEYAISEATSLFKIAVQKIDSLIWGEINNSQHLKYVEDKVIPRLIKIENERELENIKNIFIEEMSLEKDEIEKIEPLGGMTNRNYLVFTKNNKYILRKSGEGTSIIIDRNVEFENCKKIEKLSIDAELVSYNSKKGIKISNYIKEAQTLNPDTGYLYLKEIAELLLKLHLSNIKFDNQFNVFSEIRRYEALLENEINYPNYFFIREKVMELEKIISNLKIELVNCHNDTLPENFIKSGNRLYLVDWEYSGLNDPLFDLAAVSVENNLNKENEKKLLNLYFKREVTKEEYLRLYIYKICQDFFWSLWTCFRELNGADFGTYGINRYNRVEKRLVELVLYK